MAKKQKKEERQKAWGLTVNAMIPMVLVPNEEENIERILNEIVDGIAAIGIQLVVVRPKNKDLEKDVEQWHDRHPHSVVLINSLEDADTVCDMAVFEDLTVERLKDTQDRELVPLAEKGCLDPFDPIAEQGNGFLYEANPWSLFAALVRAAETYRFPYDWKNLMKANRKKTA